ncbi:MAG TPA: hypothetical protein VLI05_03610 [Candidatus Saccharimonadia bacterium]|nr:hypothetical protein [Candidatus Saccharimonadia bacterium]
MNEPSKNQKEGDPKLKGRHFFLLSLVLCVVLFGLIIVMQLNGTSDFFQKGANSFVLPGAEER